YRLVPALPWFGLFMGFCHMLCVFLILKRLLAQTDNQKMKLLLAVLGVLGITAVLLEKFIYIQYTVTSGLLAGTAIFWFVTTPDRVSLRDFNKQNIVSVVLFIVGFWMRWEMVLSLCPLVAAAGIYKWSAGAKQVGLRFFCRENYRKYLLTVLAVVLGVGLSLLCDRVAYGSEEWRVYRIFDDIRTELYDFRGRAPEYEGNEEFYAGIGLSEEEVELLVNYNYALSEEMNTELVQEIMDYELEEKGVGYFRYSLSDGFAYYRWQMIHLVDRPWMVVVVAGYALVLAAGLLNGHFSIIWQLFLLGVTRTFSWMYIFLRGRLYDRVNHPLYLGEILILIAMLLIEFKQLYSEKRKKEVVPGQTKQTTGQQGLSGKGTETAGKRGSAAIGKTVTTWERLRTALGTATVLAFGAIFGVYTVTGVQDALEEKASMEEEYAVYYQTLQDYCAVHSDQYFLIDVYSYTTTFEPVFLGEDSLYRNYDICGGWAAKSPVYAKKLAYFGITDLIRDLAQREDVLFISRDDRDVDWLEAYYSVKGYDVEVTAVDHIDTGEDEGYTVYAVSLAG
ncbi:MAG: hypothetical protein LUE87_00500, partial [Lachnospiraceae bacterium]|nr:hypothetical protein [Lachnospiraceae bacterium]